MAEEHPESAEPVENAAEAEPRDDGRDKKLAEQAARIEQLTRAYAALVEDQKAFRARTERENDRVVEAERFGVLQALLEALDELDRALSAALGASRSEVSPAMQALLEGVKLTRESLLRRVASLGATRLEVVGRKFDPRVAEAVDAVAVADHEQDELVLSEVRAGWTLGDRILRPARVRVGRLARA